MTSIRIIPFGDPVLRRKSTPVTVFGPELKALLHHMTDTLYATDGRAGLAAPQIGVLQQVVVMDCGEGLIELINPEILERRGVQNGPEACLSLPGYWGTVKRAKHVKIKYFDRKGREGFLEATDFPARCMQHEIDHLQGVLYIDHVGGRFLYEDQTNHKIPLRDILLLSNKEC